MAFPSTIIILFFVLLILIVVVYLYMQQPQFGRSPEGERRVKISGSPNFKNGSFQNQSPTPALAEEASWLGVMKKFFFTRNKRGIPSALIPSVKTNLKNIPQEKEVLVWFGHSSYFIQLGGKKILVDPVLSGNASPIRSTTRSFKGSDVYTTDDLPEIDYLFITHDHYDHLDYETISRIKPKVKKVITGLGVGAHLEHWGYDKNIIEELDWNEELVTGSGFVINAVPARHFSGRGFRRNGTLWLSFILSAPSVKIFMGGDSGYDDHFKSIGEAHGPFDLAILENGQYNPDWKYIHMMPEEVVQAAIDLRANWLFPVHWSKFRLALHDWDEPMNRVAKEAERKNVAHINPMIGEEVNLKDLKKTEEWWKEMQ